MTPRKIWQLFLIVTFCLYLFSSCAHSKKKESPDSEYSVQVTQVEKTEGDLSEDQTLESENREQKPVTLTEAQEEMDQEMESTPAEEEDTSTGLLELKTEGTPTESDDQEQSTTMSREESLNKAFKELNTSEKDGSDVDNVIKNMQIPDPPPSYHPYLDAEKLAAQSDSKQLITLNFNNEPIASVLKSLFADTLKLNYILDKGVAGNITIVTTTPFMKGNLFDVILLILKMNGLTVSKAGDYYLIVPTGDINKYMIPTKTGTDPNEIEPSERIVTQVVPLLYTSPSELSTIITQMKSDDTQLITLDAANILIFTGPASNIRRMMEMIKVLDIETAQEEFKVFQIKYADANDILKTLQQLFTKKISGRGIPSAPNQPARRNPRNAKTAAAPAPAGGGIISVGSPSGEPVMLVDQRSNSLIVFGTTRDIEFIEKIIGIFDVDIYTYQEIFIYYVENAKAKDLKAILDDLYKGQSKSQQKNAPPVQQQQKVMEDERPGQIVGDLNISVDERTNALIIQTTYRNYKILEKMIQKLDLIPKQVLIEVLIAEVTLDDAMELGFQWNLKSSGTIGDNKFSSTTSTNYDVPEAPGLQWTIFEATRWTSFLRTFATDNKIEVLSNPHIMCSNNTEAKIEVGNEIPTITSSTTNTSSTTVTGANVTSTVEYRNTGIILTVNARVNERRMVSIDLSQEVSEAQVNDLGGTSSPIIRKRSLQSSVVMRDNQTLVMGGFMQRKKDLANQGVPLLSKIPFLRWLFGTESRTSSKTELIIFITPHVIGDPTENFEKTNEFLQKLPRVEKMREKVENE